MAQAADCCNSPLTVEQAATTLVTLIASRPTSPHREEIEAVLARMGKGCASRRPEVIELGRRVRSAISALAAAEVALVAAEDRRPVDEATCLRATVTRDLRYAELRFAEMDIPQHPRCFDDVLMRAEIAGHFADKTFEGQLITDDLEDNWFRGPAARLIKAVLAFRPDRT